MPAFLLETALVLAVSALVSVLVIALTLGGRDEGKIKLPHYSVDEGSLELEGEYDPFNVTTIDDVVDGYPIDAEAFWVKVRLPNRKGLTKAN